MTIYVNNKICSLSTDNQVSYLQTPKTYIYSRYGGDPIAYPMPEPEQVIFESKDADGNYITGTFEINIPVYGLYDFTVCNAGMRSLYFTSSTPHSSWASYVSPGGLSGTKHTFKVYLNSGRYKISIPKAQSTSLINGSFTSEYYDYVSYTCRFPSIVYDKVEISQYINSGLKRIYKLEHTLTTRDWTDTRIFKEVTSNTSPYSAINRGLSGLPNCFIFANATGNQYYIGDTLAEAANNDGTITTDLTLIDSTTFYNKPRQYKYGSNTYDALLGSLSPIDNTDSGPGAGGRGQLSRTNTAQIYCGYTAGGPGYMKIIYKES